MKINRFDKVEGQFIEEIIGQRKFGYSLNEMMENYEGYDITKTESIKGNVLTFYELNTGKIFIPFEEKRNILYSGVTYLKGSYYFLRCDFNEQVVYLYRYFPGQRPAIVTELNMENVDMYNLRILGEEVHIISQGEQFRCYYPEQFSFDLEPPESVIAIEDEKVYLTKWIEEGWEDMNERPSEDYRYYEKLIVRDFKGNKISEEVGNLFQNDQGEWWIS